MKRCLTAIFFLSVAMMAEAETKPLLQAIIAVESHGDDRALGDTNMRNKAHGCLQVRQHCVDDVNETFGTSFRAEQCLGNRALSIWIFERYMERYATAERLGHEPTDEDRARIWNGGPNGWRRNGTLAYWAKVKKEMSSPAGSGKILARK